MIIVIVLSILMPLLNGSRLFLSNMKMSDQEQEEIASFYEINSDAIVKSDLFDFKYVYRDPNRPFRSNVIEVVAKNDKAIMIDGIEFYDKSGTKICNYGNMQRKFTAMKDEAYCETFVPNDGFRGDYFRMGHMWLTICQYFYQHSKESRIVNPDFDEIELLIFSRDSVFDVSEKKETVHLIYDEESRFQTYRSIKERYMNGEECNLYEKRHIAYYFGILYYREFNQWYTEIKEYISYLKEINDYSTLSYKYMLNYPWKDELGENNLQEFMHLDNEQFVKYQEVIQIFDDLRSTNNEKFPIL